jgi:hypothetical protein
MDNINEVTLKHIKSLSDIELTRLLDRLLNLEAAKNALTDSKIDVPLQITSADAGEDGSIKWTTGPTNTTWLPNRYTSFQVKATALPAGKCLEEILKPELKPQPRQLKDRVDDVVRADGAYILFTNISIVAKGKADRIAAFRSAISSAHHSNHSTMIIDVYDANVICRWTNEYISAVTQVQADNGITRKIPFLTMGEWEARLRDNSVRFKSNKALNDKITVIQSEIMNAKAIRVFGHSGLGKTRLVYECFKTSSLANLVVYCDLKGDDNFQALHSFITSHQEKMTGVLVIDNCGALTHIKLAETVKAFGHFKLVTIGFDDSTSIEDIKIRFDRNEQRDIVREVIAEMLGGSYAEKDIDYVHRLCEGYPGMATKFCTGILQLGLSKISQIPVQNFIRNLLSDTSEKDLEYDVIRACSVFSSFGFNDDSFKDVLNKDIRDFLNSQAEYIRTRIIDGTVTETKFKEIVGRFKRNDLIEQRGRFFAVKPTILAVHLAADWLINTSEERIIAIIQELKGRNLDQQFLDRFKDLDQLDKAREIVSELWGNGRPFSTAEVLNTQWGSLLFRYVVEVNPEATVKALTNAFGAFSKDQLYGIEDGRRNLVWALEKLCFRKETFIEAAKMLYRFAAGENETIGNNSLNQFRQLFHVLLPGTEADLKQRVKILEWGIGLNDDDYMRIAIEAMASGISHDHFHRMGGAEMQGSGPPLKDYQPNNLEIIDYWTILSKYLVDIALSDSMHAIYAREKFASSIRTLASANLIDLILDLSKKIIIKYKSWWPAALSSLRMTIAFESHLTDESKNKLQSLIEQLSPTDIGDRLKMTVGNPEWYDPEKDHNGEYIDKQKLKAEELAGQIAAQKIDLEPHLHDLLQGDQIQGFNFGKALAIQMQEGGNFLTKSIDVLGTIDSKLQNSSIIAGLVAGFDNNELTIEIFRRFICDPDLSRHGMYLLASVGLTPKLFDVLMEEIEKGVVAVKDLRVLQYGRALEKIEMAKMAKLVSIVGRQGKSGRWAALSLLFMYSYSKNEFWKEYRKEIRELIISDNLLVGNDGETRLEGYHWSESIKNVLAGKPDLVFAQLVIKQIIEFFERNNFNFSMEVYIRSALNTLFENYFKDVWPIIGEALIGEHFIFSRFAHAIGTNNGNSMPSPGVAFSNKNRWDVVFEWCRIAGPKAAERISNMMPFEAGPLGQEEWHPFAKLILDNFGINRTVLKNLSANMGTYGTVGSQIPYFLMQQRLFKSLVDHPIEEVRIWAKDNGEIITKIIKSERLSDEETFS